METLIFYGFCSTAAEIKSDFLIFFLPPCFSSTKKGKWKKATAGKQISSHVCGRENLFHCMGTDFSIQLDVQQVGHALCLQLCKNTDRERSCYDHWYFVSITIKVTFKLQSFTCLMYIQCFGIMLNFHKLFHVGLKCLQPLYRISAARSIVCSCA